MKIVKLVLSLFIPAILISQFFSCSNPAGSYPVENQILNMPVITGIVEIDTGAYNVQKKLGIPNEKEQITLFNSRNIPEQCYFNGIIPNPASDATDISFSLPINANVSIWIVRGTLPENLKNKAYLYLNCYISQSSNNFYMELQRNKAYPGGFYYYHLNLKDSNSSDLPNGFYRVYLEINGNLMWRNLWIYNNKNIDSSLPSIF